MFEIKASTVRLKLIKKKKQVYQTKLDFNNSKAIYILKFRSYIQTQQFYYYCKLFV